MKSIWFKLLSVAFLPLCAAAQSYPNKPIRLVVPWAAGSTADVAARVVGERILYQNSQIHSRHHRTRPLPPGRAEPKAIFS